LNGEHDFTTDKSESFLNYNYGPPSRNGGPSDNLKPLEGPMGQLKSESQKKFKSYGNVVPPEKVKFDDNIKLDGGELETDRSRDEYGRFGEAGRVTPFRHSSMLNQQGDIDFSTEKSENYKYHGNYSQVKGERPGTNLRQPDGTMRNYKTESQKR